MQYTPKYNLAKPDDGDAVDITVLNQNTDKVDAELQKLRREALTPETAVLYDGATTPNEALRNAMQIAPWNKIFSKETAGAFSWTAPDLFDRKPYEIGVFLISGAGSGAVWRYTSTTTGVATGGASGKTLSFILRVTPGHQYNLVVGVGGASVTPGGGYNSRPGLTGGSTSFDGKSIDGGAGGVERINNAYEFTDFGAQMPNTNLYFPVNAFGGSIMQIVFPTGTGFIPHYGNPAMCFNPFEGRRILGAGGIGRENMLGRAGGKDPVTGLGGGDGAYAVGAANTVVATAGESPGCGGGGAGGGNNATPTSGAGADGAVYIYIRGKLA